MAEYIKKEDLKFLEIPIAPVIQGEQVHYEQGFLKEWLESVPTANVIERSKIDKAIDEIIEKSFISDIYNDRTDDEIIKVDDVLEIFKKHIGE